MRMSQLTAVIALLSVPCCAQRSSPANLNFRESDVGQPPAGWMAAARGFPAVVSDQCSKAGNLCAILRTEKVPSPAPFGNLMQYVSAYEYRGRGVIYRASVRVEGSAGTRAALWMRVDRPNQQMGFFDNMANRPIQSSDWATYEIKGEVADDAVGIAFGVMLSGAEGKAYVDNVWFEATGAIAYAPVVERSRPLTDRGLTNMIAYARLFGYVRHFYPGDEAAAADWDALAVNGVRVVEDAADPATLAARLNDLFRPVAPLVRVFPTAIAAPSIEVPTGPKILSMEHHGFGGGATQGIYRTKRITTAATNDRARDPFWADSGAGVRALIPLAVYADDKGTLPHTANPVAKPAVAQYRAEDRAARLAGVIIAWNVLQHFYPYFDVVNTNWPKALEDGLRSAAAGSADNHSLTLRRLVAALNDGHGRVGPGETGAGSPVAWAWIENRLVVTYVPDRQDQLISAGDTVLSINGKPVAEVLAAEEALVSGASPQWIRYRALVNMGMGAPDKPLVLEIEPFQARSEKRTVTLKRRAGQFVSEPRPSKIAELKTGIWYVDLARVNDSEFAGAIDKLTTASGIVFDLRGYPSLGPSWLSHLSEKKMTSAQWHVPVVTEPDHANMKFERGGEWDLRPVAPYLKAKKAVLTDGRAISYAESTMGIVEYYKLAEIVGSTTAGTNGNINQIHVPGGYTLVFTGMKVLKHDGSRHHGVGIKPTIPVERTRAGVAAGRDEVLEAGITVVQ